MGARAEQLATQLEAVNADVIATVEGCPDAQWRTAKTGPEGWPVNVVAHHVGDGHGGISGLVQMIASGQQPPPLTMEMINQGNAKHAQDFANCDKAEALRLLREGGAAAVAAVRGLSD